MNPVYWWPESCDLRDEFPSGTTVRQVSSSPAITHNIYHEQPMCSRDGHRLALFRTFEGNPREPGELLVYDIESYQLASLGKGVFSLGVGMAAIATSSWSGQVFAVVRQNDQHILVHFDLDTLERHELFEWPNFAGDALQTVSPDGTWGLFSERVDEDTFGIFRLDLHSGRRELIHQSPHIGNPHLQVRLHSGTRILVQENRGCIVDAANNMVRSCDERGVGLYSIDTEGKDRCDFPVGPPFTPATTGHECWIGDTGRVLVTLGACITDGTRSGNVVEVSHEWDSPRVVFDSPHIWNHVSASRCGRYLIADTYDQPGTPILVGNIATGKTAVLCPSHAAGGGAQYAHAHPYLTGDNKWAVFNSNRNGGAQVCLASVLPEFLDGVS